MLQRGAVTYASQLGPLGREVAFEVGDWTDLGRHSNQTIFAIGDVHGCAAQLAVLHDLISGVARDVDRGDGGLLVYLGDYVDRGQESLLAMDLVAAGVPCSDLRHVRLTGNHDQMLRLVLDGGENVRERALVRWWLNGGSTVLGEVGLDIAEAQEDFDAFCVELKRRLGSERTDFLRLLSTCERTADGLVFVHAGVSPNEDLATFLARGWDFFPEPGAGDSSPLWIRDSFLGHEGDLPEGVFVVHGHTPEAVPALRGHRLGLDAGSYFTGVVAAAEVRGNRFRLLRATSAPSLP